MIILGLSKGGFGALGMLTVPILALVISPVQAAAIVLPILVLSDVVALFSYRGMFDATTLKIMLPGAIVGIAIGWWTAAWVTEQEIRLIVGAISVAFALNYWLRADWARRDVDRRTSSRAASGARSPASPVSSAMPAVRRSRCTPCRCVFSRASSLARR